MTHARPTGLLRALLGCLALAVLWAALVVAAAPARAQTAGGTNIRVALVADGPPVPGREWTLALYFVPVSPEWHGYWQNPGDAGAGMRLKWTLPPGWRAGEPLYPVPMTLTVAGLMNHVFEGPHAVLVPVTVPADAGAGTGTGAGKPAPIALDIDYLACTDRICVPERARLTLDPAAAVADARFDRWRAALAPPLDRPVAWRIAGQGERRGGADPSRGGALRIAIPLPAAMPLAAPHVFIANRDLVNYAAPQRFLRDGDRLIAEIPLAASVVTPAAIEGILALGDGNGFRFAGAPGAVPAGGTPLSGPAPPSPWLALAGALLGGLLLNVMPCVFPILSLKALALARAGGDERRARRDALAYTAGAVLACLALGALMLVLRAGGEQVGWAFQLQEPSVVAALLVLAVAITANFLGAFDLPALRLAGRGAGWGAGGGAGMGKRAGAGGSGGSFATGLLAAFVATPCTGPFMAAALGAALLLPPPQALALFAALGLGLALPFLLLGFVPRLRRLLPRPGPWMARFQRWMALPMGLTALALVWLAWRLAGWSYALACLGLAALLVTVLVLVWGRGGTRTTLGGTFAALAGAGFCVLALGLPRLETASEQRAEAGILDAQPFSEAALARARASGKPVFLWFTADWCLTCKVNEAAAIERESTRAAFARAGVIVLRGDWTRRDESITRFLASQGVAGVPLYLWYPPGSAPPRQLPQVLTPALLAELASGTTG